ncbi:hypothetical protein Tco_0237710 [Tanacetum coccineum]
MAGEDEFHDDNPPPPPVTPTQQAPHTLSTIKLPILKKGEYDIWAMKMEHYLGHTRRRTSSSDGVTTSLDGVSPYRLNSDLEDSTL